MFPRSLMIDEKKEKLFQIQYIFTSSSWHILRLGYWCGFGPFIYDKDQMYSIEINCYRGKCVWQRGHLEWYLSSPKNSHHHMVQHVLLQKSYTASEQNLRLFNWVRVLEQSALDLEKVASEVELKMNTDKKKSDGQSHSSYYING